jgi:hypothetical protein
VVKQKNYYRPFENDLIKRNECCCAQAIPGKIYELKSDSSNHDQNPIISHNNQISMMILDDIYEQTLKD